MVIITSEAEARISTTLPGATTPSARWNRYPAWIVLLLGLLLTTAATLDMNASVKKIALLEFTAQCDEIQDKISDRLEEHVLLLQSGAALFNASEKITRDQWRIFTQHQKLEQHLPGIQGVGFALLIPRDELTRHVRELRSEGYPEYNVKPDGARDVYSAIIYLEPFSGRNLRAFGYDMLSEPVRRAAMEQARDLNTAALSGKIVLVQETGADVQAGTLMYVPVYHKGLPLETVAQRRAALQGWVYSPYRMNDLMQGILGRLSVKHASQIHLQVYDGPQPSPQSLLYESLSAADRKLPGDERSTRRIKTNGRIWTLCFSHTGGGCFTMAHLGVWLTMAGGMTVTLLLFALIRVLLNTRVKAQRIAENLTLALKESKQFAINVMDSLTSNIAVLDAQGIIVAVNESWRNFAVANSDSGIITSHLGLPYLDVCRDGEEGAEAAFAGISAVLQGEQGRFTMEYPCNSPVEPRWFTLRATKLKGSRYGVVVSHTNITEQKQLATALQHAHDDLELIVYERTRDLSGANERLVQEIDAHRRVNESFRGAVEEIKRLQDRLQAENIYLQQEVAGESNFSEIIGQCSALSQVFLMIEQVAPQDVTVLLLGETGTGKGVLARAIHSRSARKDRPMITVNCSSLPANLIENELFGREKGAYTGAHTRQIGRFELADGGTIFLDEIGEMPLELQSRLLRVIQDGEFERLGSPLTHKTDVRIIAATNRNLEQEISHGRFRRDLFYRLSVFPITIPPLRQRPEDILLLAKHFVIKYNKKIGRKIETIPMDTLNALREYHWPGNVRELESVIERAVITSQGAALQMMDRFNAFPEEGELAVRDIEALAEVEHHHILQALQKTGWRIQGTSGAAKLLGLNPSTLRARMRKFGILRQDP